MSGLSPTDIWRATNFQRLQFTGVEADVAFRPTATHEIEWQYTGLTRRAGRARAANFRSTSSTILFIPG